ncbi:MAG: hypothetical protein M1825_003175 [Sarcosagium campestre]|nr:MAG: hypothetical protein M1825_003175 [Sarcosagium campestre]
MELSDQLALLCLPKDTFLLPGILIRIPVSNRADVPHILSHLYAQANEAKALSVNSEPLPMVIGCVPLASSLLSRDGRNLLGNNEDIDRLQADHRDVEPDHATKDDLFSFGTAAKVMTIEGKGTGELAIVVEGLRRFRIEAFTQEQPFLRAQVTYCGPNEALDASMESARLQLQLRLLSRQLLALIRYSALLPGLTASAESPLLSNRLTGFLTKKTLDEPGVLADFMLNLVEASYEEKLQVLAAWDVETRVERVVELLSRQVKAMKGSMKITAFTSSLPIGIDNGQRSGKRRDSFTRGILSSLRNGSRMSGGQGDDGGGGANEEINELDELKKKLEDAKLTPEADKVAQRELKRLRKMNPAIAEHQVCRSYLETLAEIPWSKSTDDRLGTDTLTRARKQLDDDHYGLEKIKKRLLEYLAVLRLKQSINAELDLQISQAATENAKATRPKDDEVDSGSGVVEPVLGDAKIQMLERRRMVDKSPILLLVGPPGTGKTSLAKSVATALGRKFHRISLGGVRDEAEIRGHRRTYVAAMPGLIVNGLKKVGVNNPVFLLDEIDKVGSANFHGDPSAAMLEVLDPEQNHTFTDHYVNIPVDLSKVLFIATANTLDTIPAPLLDRMETISLSGYTTLEKRHIASRHLVPKQIMTNGLQEGQVRFEQDVLDKIITAYTRESGVRNLEREIGSVCRYKAVEYADAKDTSTVERYNATVTTHDVETILGIEKYDEEIAETSSRPGIVTGLVAYSSGGSGSILFIEVADMPGAGRVQLTGKLGEVLKESVEVALTWVKAHAFELGLTADPTDDIMKQRGVHVHCPAGAVPKDGPSAGLAHTIALISLFSGKPVPPTLAMTGEISLRGRVTAVGGIKEKLIGALRAGVKTVLLPERNRKDAADLPQEVKDGLRIVHVSHIWEAMQHVWPQAHWPGEEHLADTLENRL